MLVVVRETSDDDFDKTNYLVGVYKAPSQSFHSFDSLGKPRSRHPPGRCTRSDLPLLLPHLSDAPAFQGGAFHTPHPHDGSSRSTDQATGSEHA